MLTSVHAFAPGLNTKGVILYSLSIMHDFPSPLAGNHNTLQPTNTLAYHMQLINDN